MNAADSSGERRDPALLTWITQLVLGAFCKLCFCLPYQRRTTGLDRVPRRRVLFVCNHVSLLDTILLGGIFWGSARLPILVLGDRQVWTRGFVRRALSARLGFLIERERPSRDLLRQLQVFGRSAAGHNLLVFPEGTRGDGTTVAPCQPGLNVIARAANVPVVPVFISGMQNVSTKTTRFRPLRGLQQISVHFGAPWQPQEWRDLPGEAFLQETRERIQACLPPNENAKKN